MCNNPLGYVFPGSKVEFLCHKHPVKTATMFEYSLQTAL